MKWYALDWFGGIKVECQECHRYATEWTEQESREKLAAVDGIACDTCELETKLVKANEQIKRLTASIHEWKYGKGGWFELREIIGQLSWDHRNCPHDAKPAPDPVPNSWLHPNETIVQEGKLVYKKEGVDWKLVGASTSEDGAKSIVRLMQMEASHEEHPGNAEGSVRGREAGSSSPDPGIGSSNPSPDGDGHVQSQEVR